MAMAVEDGIRHAFRETFGAAEHLVVRSPGRINLIGEHTDYNEGFVLPAAIDRSILLAARRRGDRRIRLSAVDFERGHETSLDEVARRAPFGTAERWTAYPLGVITILLRDAHPLGGFDLAFGGDLPVGAGLSSSAAVTCGVALTLDALFGLGLNRMELARVAQAAEHEFAGVRCGIMDQLATLYGRDGHALRIDCRDRSLAYVAFPVQSLAIVVCESGVGHELAESGYNERRAQCEAGVAILQRSCPDVHSLRDVDPALLEEHSAEMDPVVARRCDYVVRENRRVLAVVDALECGDLAELGALLFESHAELAHDYDVSTRELDALVDAARSQPGILGARMMGAGFGGSTLNVVARERIDGFLAGMRKACAGLGLPDRMHLCAPAGAAELLG